MICTVIKSKPILEFRGRYFFLSNFYRVEFVFRGMKYPTSEHAFQACKSSSDKVKSQIAVLPSAFDAKAAGRALKLAPDWNTRRVEYMRAVVTTKFEIPYLRDKLLATGEAKLVEGNTWRDDYWGAIWKPSIGFVGTSWAKNEEGNRVLAGQNMLGRILMELRDDLNV